MKVLLLPLHSHTDMDTHTCFYICILYLKGAELLYCMVAPFTPHCHSVDDMASYYLGLSTLPLGFSSDRRDRTSFGS